MTREKGLKNKSWFKRRFTKEGEFEELVSQKLEQLDYWYLQSDNILAKLDILDQMITFCEVLGVNGFVDENEWLQTLIEATLAYQAGQVDRVVEIRRWANKLYMRILKALIEKGLISAFKIETDFVGLEV